VIEKADRSRIFDRHRSNQNSVFGFIKHDGYIAVHQDAGYEGPVTRTKEE